ncbi:MAG: phage major capsid protein [Oscillospiraceae bacterium]|nr:phage major capsid protein [Oscillospiraceae bacterium]
MTIKALSEQREDLQEQLDVLVATAETEQRAMSEEERAEFDRLESEIRAADETLERLERARRASRPAASQETEDRAAEEERAFADYVMGRVQELRSGEQNVTMANNGAVIPTTIANRIIKAVKDRCPILANATLYSVKGTLKVPVWGKANSTHDIAVGYQSEFTDITADAGKFTSVDLGGYLIGALTLIGKSVENNAQFSVVDFIVDQMAEEIATFVEGELLKGTGSSACQGALNSTNTLTAAGTAAITADELITLQAKVKQAFQKNAYWTMHPDTFTYIKKLKDQQNRYLLQDDITGEFPFRLLGKPVYLSDNMPTIAASAKTVLYGDPKGLSVNIREGMSIQLLREKYATMHAIGVVAWMELDSKVTDSQRLAVLVQKASS